MQPNPAVVAETREWLETVAIDLESAASDMAHTPPILAGVVFHCQQAVEKVLKAFLTWHDQPFAKTHDLARIGKPCVALDASLLPLVERAVPLTEYAWRGRYPGERLKPTLEEAQRALALAQDVVEAVTARIPLPTEPDA
ncbi:MAG TPA: HEPN domain-containing protein [Armatimonadota bacterium]|jgi:HEPN domain-containing protein